MSALDVLLILNCAWVVVLWYRQVKLERALSDAREHMHANTMMLQHVIKEAAPKIQQELDEIQEFLNRNS